MKDKLFFLIGIYIILFAQISLAQSSENTAIQEYDHSRDFEKQTEGGNYSMYIGQQIVFLDNENSDRQFDNFTSLKPDTIWIKKRKKNPKPTDYKVVHSYKYKDVIKTIRGKQIVSYYTPASAVANKVFEIIDVEIKKEKTLPYAYLLLKDESANLLYWRICVGCYVTPLCHTISYFNFNKNKYKNKYLYKKANGKWERTLCEDVVLKSKANYPKMNEITLKLKNETEEFAIPLSESKYIFEEEYRIHEKKEEERKRVLRENEGNYNISLVKVDKAPSATKGRIENIKDANNIVVNCVYTDNIIKIKWNYPVWGEGFVFTLENISESTIKVMWDEASYINVRQSASRIIHEGIKLANKEMPQPPSVIIKKASINESVTPVEKITYGSSLRDWYVEKLFVTSEKEYIDNKIVKILLPLQIHNVKNEYIFSFIVKWNPKYPKEL